MRFSLKECRLVRFGGEGEGRKGRSTKLKAHEVMKKLRICKQTEARQMQSSRVGNNNNNKNTNLGEFVLHILLQQGREK